MRRFWIWLALTPFLSVFGLSGCELSSNLGGTSDSVQSVFSRQIQPTLNQKCTSCHGLLSQEAGLSLASWEELFQGSQYGDVVIPFSPARSLLLRMAAARVGGAHPGELASDTLSQNELQLLREWITDGAPSDDGTVAFEDAEDLLYVANQEAATVSIIDMTKNVVVRVVDLRDHGYSATAKPHHVAVEPDGSYWYVSLIGENRVARFDRLNNLSGEFEFETPGMLAMDPVGDWLYAGRSLSAPSPPASIGKIRRSDMSGEVIPVVFPRPHALTTDPTGAFVYSSSLGQNHIITYETASGDVTFSPVAGPIHSFVQHAVSPDGGTLAATAQLTSQILFFDLATPATPAFSWSVGANASPWHPVFAPDGLHLYVGNKDANTVTVVSVVNRRVESIITGDGLAEPHGSALSPDGSLLYISNRNSSGSFTPRHDLGDNGRDGTVVVIDRVTGDITKVLEVGPLAAGLGTR
jgi:YVTN family beta-propeller protein